MKTKETEIREDIKILRIIERQLEENLLQRRYEIAVAKEMFDLGGRTDARTDNAG